MRKLEDLTPEFENQARQLIVEVENRHGYIMRPFFTRRTVYVQAKLWRQSRGAAEIERAIDRLTRRGATFLAKVLRDVGPQYGKWATNALPGLSWHNWGRAVDCFLLIDGHACWDDDHIGYRMYAETAKELGLVAGYFWGGHSQDPVHVQPTKARVIESKTWAEINDAMQSEY